MNKSKERGEETLEKAEQDGESEHHKPDNMNQKKSLAGAAITDLADPEARDGGPGATRFGASAPVGDAVDATHRIRSEAFHGAWLGHPRPTANASFRVGVGGVAGKPDDGRRDGRREADGEDDIKDDERR